VEKKKRGGEEKEKKIQTLQLTKVLPAALHAFTGGGWGDGQRGIEQGKEQECLDNEDTVLDDPY